MKKVFLFLLLLTATTALGTYIGDPVTVYHGGTGLTTVPASGKILIGNGSAYGLQSVSGDITINSSGVTAIGSNKVTNSQLSQMGAHTFKGNNTGSTANALDLTQAQLTAELNQFTTSLQGVVPASGGGTTNFLRADGSWAAPSGSGDVSGPSSSVDGEITLFNGTTGKLIKRATGTGFVKATSGVYSTSSTVNAASELTGITPVANGGTGANTLTSNNVILGNGTSAVQFVAPGTSGNVLTSNGTTWQSTAPSSGITQLTGDVTAGPGSGSQAATIANNAVTNAKAAQMAANTIKGNNTGSTANASDLTATQTTAMLNAMVGDSGSGGTKGLVPAPASGDAAAGKFLKADGTWSVPAGGGGTNCTYWVSTPSGYGSTNTAYRKYSATVTNTGSCVTYTASSTLGDKFTFNTAGLYSVEMTDGLNSSSNGTTLFGITLNSTSGTTSINSFNPPENLAYYQSDVPSGSATVVAEVSRVYRFAVNDVIRGGSHISGSYADCVSAKCGLKITYLGP